MLVSYKWLKQYVDLPDSLTAEELGLKLTMTTVEVEGIEKQGKILDNIVVGHVKKVDKHPDADKLVVAIVSDGTDDFQVICGGINVVENMKVAYAKVGARVHWHGEDELVELTRVTIRGQESYGMICASEEIGLADMFPAKDEQEILDISHIDVQVGIPLADALGLDDIVFDIDNKSMTHRPDLWGHVGMAREVAVAYKKPLKTFDSGKISAGKGLDLSVTVEDTTLCPRYMAVAMDDIVITPSPHWLQQRLLAVGLRPINNIVDITNFIMYDVGQPMHAFDAGQLHGTEQNKHIVVRHAHDGETFTTLDEQEYKLTNDMLVIADTEKTIAVAGVKGGLHSGISDNTTTIIFESANFDATSVRRSATALGLRTDSSARFEKSLDPYNCDIALRRAVALIQEMCPSARVVSDVIDVAHMSIQKTVIDISISFIHEKIGVDIPEKDIIHILERLGFDIKQKKEILSITVPSWRATKDIAIPEDIVEEIARVYGYDNIATDLPVFPIIPPSRNILRELERRCKTIAVMHEAYTENLNYSFVSPQMIDTLGLVRDEHIMLANPIAKDRPYLRRTLIMNLLENIEKNIHEYDDVALCEVGKIFIVEEPGQRMEDKGDELLPRQDVMFAAVCAQKNNELPYKNMISLLQALCRELHVSYTLVSYTVNPHRFIHPARAARIMIGDTDIGMIAELHPAVGQDIGIDTRVGLFEINLVKLLPYIDSTISYHGVNNFPSVHRDIAFVVDNSVLHQHVVDVIQAVDALIHRVILFDIFRDKKLGSNKKSMAYHISYASYEKTLEAKDVDIIHEKVREILKEKFDAEVRS